MRWDETTDDPMTHCQKVSGLPSLRLSTPKPNLWEDTVQVARFDMSLLPEEFVSRDRLGIIDDALQRRQRFEEEPLTDDQMAWSVTYDACFGGGNGLIESSGIPTVGGHGEWVS